MDLLTELNLGADWGLGLCDQPNGLFGDLEDLCHLKGDMDPAFKPRDAVQQMVLSPESSHGHEPLELEWMESGDLVSFLTALDNGESGLSTPQDDLLDCTPSIGVKETVSVLQADNYFGMGVNNLLSLGQTLTPPDSPEQVTPVITFPFEQDNLASTTNTSFSVSHTVTNDLQNSVNTPPQFPVVDFQHDFLIETSDPLFDLHLVNSDTKEGIPLFTDNQSIDSSDEQEVVVTSVSNSASSSRSTTPKPDIDRLIESSPELYKVIATPVSSRFSPYPKAKSEPKSKSKSKAKKSALHASDYDLLISEHYLTERNLGKKERKKLQNKNAAIRYRQKKKAEVEVICTEVQDLEKRNGELKGRVDDLQREIKYMKNLMEEIYKAKGLIIKRD